MLDGNFGCVPVVNPSREIVRLVFWKELFQGEAAVKPQTAAQICPSSSWREAGNPPRALHQCSSQAAHPHRRPHGHRNHHRPVSAYGLDRFHLSINYKSKILKSFFEELAPVYSVAFLEEKEPRGTAGGLRALYDRKPENLIVTNCDIVIQADLADLVAFHIDEQLRSHARRVAQGLPHSLWRVRTGKGRQPRPALRRSRSTAFS